LLYDKLNAAGDTSEAISNIRLHLGWFGQFENKIEIKFIKAYLKWKW